MNPRKFYKALPAGSYEEVRIDLAERISSIFNYNRTRNSAHFLLVYNTAYYVSTKQAYYTQTAIVDAVNECKPALDDFMHERNSGDVSELTMMRVAIMLGRVRDCLLDVRYDHYEKAAEEAYLFSTRGKTHGTERKGCADSNQPRKAGSRLRRSVDAMRCHRFTRRELIGSVAHSGGNRCASSRYAA